MDRRGFLAAGVASVATVFGGCVAVPAESRPPAFVFGDFETVTDVVVAPDGQPFVAGTTGDMGAAVVELGDRGEARWRFARGDWTSEPHVRVTRRTLFVGAVRAGLVAIDRAERAARWRGPWVRSWPFPVGAERAFLASGDYVLAARLADGRTEWTHNPPPKWLLSPTWIVGGTVVCSGGGGRIRGLSVDDGSERWTHVLGGDLPPTFHRDGTVYAGTGTDADDPKAVAIDAASGEIRWTVRTGDTIVSPDPGSRNVYLPDRSRGAGTLAVDPTTGDERWQRSGVWTAFATPSGPIGVDGSGNVVALDPVTGEDRWRYGTSTWEGTRPEVELAGATVIVVDPDGIAALDVESGRRRWHHATSVGRLPRVESGRSIVVVETGGSVMGFRLGE